MKSSLGILIGVLILLSCSNENKNSNNAAVITFNDFEALDGWVEIPPSVNKERAYSGKYSIKVGSDIEFSLGFQKKLGLVTNARPQKIKVSAMAFVPGKETGKAILAFSLTNSVTNEQVLYEEIKLEKVSSFRKWVKVEKEINLPEKADFNNILKVYLWRGQASEEVYIDDLKVTVQY